MRILEILIYLVIVLHLTATIVFGNDKKRWQKYLALSPIIMIVLHVIFEGYRWQMEISYAVSAIIVFLLGVRVMKRRTTANGQNDKSSRSDNEGVSGKIEDVNETPAKRNKYVVGLRIVLLFIFAATISIPILLPVVHLPEPSGPYSIGTTRFQLVDDSRKEILTEDENDVRELMVTAWYPAYNIRSEKVKSYWTKKDLKNKVYENLMFEGNFWYEYLALSKTNSRIHVPISDKLNEYPVIIYSHSYISFETENTILCEELASQGYVVFAIAHSYETFTSVFPEERLVRNDLSHIEQIYGYSPEKEIESFEAFMNAMQEASNDEEKTAEVFDYMTTQGMLNKLIEIRAEDVRFVLDELTGMNKSSGMFEGALDLENIGVVGWSFGGATGIEASYEDDRIDAVVNMDGWPYGSHVINQIPMKTPLLFLANDRTHDGGYEAARTLRNSIAENSETECILIEVPGTQHGNFSDYATLFSAMELVGLLGPQDPADMHKLHQEETVKFLDKYLK